MNLEQFNEIITTKVMTTEMETLSVRQLAILTNICVAETPRTVRGLAETLNIPKPSVTRGMDRLSEMGMAARRKDPADGRSILLVPTTKGIRQVSGLFADSDERRRAA